MKLIKAFWHALNYGASKTLSDIDKQVISLVKSSLSSENAAILNEQMHGLTYIQRWVKGKQGEVVTLSPGANVSFDGAQLPKFKNTDAVFLLAELQFSADKKRPDISIHLSRGLFRSIEYHCKMPNNIQIPNAKLIMYA